MRLAEFIQKNRRQIDEYIQQQTPNIQTPLNQEARRHWILNDEYLYLWARREGVRI